VSIFFRPMPPSGSHSHGRQGRQPPSYDEPLGPYRREDYRPQEFQRAPEFDTRESFGDVRQRAWADARAAPEPRGIQPLEVIDLHPSNFNNVVLDPARTVVVAFYAPWCKAPEVERLLHDLQEDLAGESNVVLGRVDADMYKDLFAHYDPSTLPAILIFPMNDKHGIEYTGPRNKPALLEFIIYQHRGEVVHVPRSGSRNRGPPPPAGPGSFLPAHGPPRGYDYVPPAPPQQYGAGPYGPLPPPPLQQAFHPQPSMRYEGFQPQPQSQSRHEGQIFPFGTYSHVLSGPGASALAPRYSTLDEFQPSGMGALSGPSYGAPAWAGGSAVRPAGASYTTTVVPYAPPPTSALASGGASSYFRPAGGLVTPSYTPTYGPADGFANYTDPFAAGTMGMGMGMGAPASGFQPAGPFPDALPAGYHPQYGYGPF